jgi:2-C-methyl-D-erythritol 4-phosphate cytidylyltransferase
VAIIPSGGSGSRFNSPIPKQYIKILGKELIYYTISVFQNSPLIDEIIIPAGTSYIDKVEDIKREYNFDKISIILEGGKERQDSVYNGLISKKFENDDLIIVHDAARPLLSESLLEKSINKALKYDSIIVAIRARDTLLKADHTVSDYLDRNEIYYAQTPQIFRYSILKSAFETAKKTGFYGTDESMLVKNAGFDVKIVEGEFINFKVTTQSDLKLFEGMLK